MNKILTNLSMRKIFSILLVILILALVFIINLPIFIKVFQLDEQLKDYIVEKLKTGNQEIINIDKLDIHYNRIRLTNINYGDHTSKSSFCISAIDFNYNIFTLFTELKKPYKSINKISFISPKVILRTVDDNIESADSLTQEKIKIDVLNILNNFDNIDQIFIKDGIICYEKENDIDLILAQELNGWLESINTSLIKFEVKGNGFQSKKDNYTNLNLNY